jgi:hypothetical protein
MCVILTFTKSVYIIYNKIYEHYGIFIYNLLILCHKNVEENIYNIYNIYMYI